MTKERKDKIIGYLTFALLIICYISAMSYHNIPSYEQDYLSGIRWLLHWATVLYLPAFPLMAGLLSALTAQNMTAFGISTINFTFTVIFTTFAYLSDVLATTWLWLSIGSMLLVLVAYYDERQKRISNK